MSSCHYIATNFCFTNVEVIDGKCEFNCSSHNRVIILPAWLGKYKLFYRNILISESDEYGIARLAENWNDICDNKRPIITVKYDNQQNVEDTKSLTNYIGQQSRGISLNQKNNLVIDIHYIMDNEISYHFDQINIPNLRYCV
jgi:hypothetical protein